MRIITFPRAALLTVVLGLYSIREWVMPLSVVVENQGPTALADVQIFVRGDSASVRRIDPGERARLRVVPTDETNLRIRTSATGNVPVETDTYLYRGSTGTLRIAVDGDSVKVVKRPRP